MKGRIIMRYVLLTLLLMLGLFVKLPHAQAQPAPNLMVIAHSDVVAAELSSSEFQKIIMGQQQRWDSGKKVTIALMKTSHPTGSITASEVYNMSEDELKKYWLSLVFQGKAKAPVFFTSEEELVNYVAVTPGAVGIVSDASRQGVKQIQVIGAPNL